MHVVVTGAAGYLGTLLSRALLGAGPLSLVGAPPEPVTALTLVDRFSPPDDLVADPRVQVVTGDLVDLLAAPGSGLLTGASAIYHLAAAVSSECEKDFDLGMRANVECSRLLLEAARASATKPLFVFASSLAVYGAWPGQVLPDVVTDSTLPTPRSSYGIQKFVVEQLVAEYTRKGFVDGRCLRLMTVSVRPGPPNAAASGFLSGIIREPLAGERAVCPVPADTRVAVSSPRRTLEGLLTALTAAAADWGPPTAFALPALELRVADMVAALQEVGGADAVALIDWVPDAAVRSIVAGWPARFDSERAHRLGLTADTDFTQVIRHYVADSPSPPLLPIL
jgi:nucleoside-diphosphate-sugar epimerase